MRRTIALATALALTTWSAEAQLSLLGLRNSLVQFALERLSTPDSFEITAGGVTRDEDGATELVAVKVADGNGVWLEIDSLSLAWNAARILRLELQIDRLAARGVRVLRRPEPADLPTPETGAPQPLTFAWPRSPITTRIDNLRLDGVEIAAGVAAAQSLAFDAEGAARDEGDTQAARLSLRRTDAVSGSIDVDYLRDFAADTLRLQLRADEAAGGLVADLAGFPVDSAAHLSIDADGPLDDWRMTFDAGAAQVFTANGGATVIVGPPLSIDAAMLIRPGPALSPAVTAALTPEARLVARVREGDDGVIAIEEGAIVSPALNLTANGAFTRQTGAVALDIDLAVGGGLAALVDGVDFSRVAFTGTLGGTLDDLAARGALALDGLRTAPVDVGAARLETSLTLTGPRIGLDVTGSAEGLRLDRIAAATVGRATLDAAGHYDGGALTLARLTLVSPLLSAQASGEADLAGGDARLDYAAEAPDLAPIARAYDTDAGGAFRATGALSGPIDAPRLLGAAALRDITFRGVPYGRIDLTHDATLGPEPTGHIDVKADTPAYGPSGIATDFAVAGRRLALSNLAAQALGAAATGAVAVHLDTGLLDGEITTQIPDLAEVGARFAVDVAGSLAGRIGLRTEDGAQTVALDLQGADIAGFDAKIGALAIDAEVKDALGTPGVTGIVTLARVAASGATADALRLEGSATDLRGALAAQGVLTASGIAARGAQIATLRLEGAGTNLRAAPEATLGAVIETVVLDTVRTARVALDAQLSQSEDAARLSARLTATPTRIGSLSLGAIVLDARVDDVLRPARVLDATARIGASDLGVARLAHVTASARGPLAALAVQLDTTGETPDGTAVALTSRARVNAADPGAIVADISALEARLGEAVAALRQTARLRIGETIALSGLDLALPGGGLRGAARLHPDGMSGDLSLAMHDLAPVAGLVGAPLRAGALDGTAVFDTRAASARARIRIEATNLVPDAALGDIGALGLAADASWNGARAQADVAVTGPFGAPLTLTAATALRPTGGLLPAVPRGAGVEGRVAWRGRLGDLWALVPAVDHLLDGNVVVDLAFSGPIGGPDFAGEVSMRDGLYQNLETGTILNNLTLTSSIAPNGALQLDLSADDGSGHPVSAQARIADGAVTARARSTRAILVRRDDATAAISADIGITGPLVGPDIAGTLTIDRAEVRLVNALPPSVATLGDVRIKGALPPEPTEPTGSGIGLDIRIEGPRDIFVRGRGLDSEWRLALAVGGSAARPTITGQVERVRGTLSLVGFPFNLDRGVIRFTGSTPIDPGLDIALTRANAGVTGGIFVRGTASDPAVTFESTPALPQDEVLPRVLFGTSQQTLSATQALQLAAGLSTLLDGTGGPLEAVRATVGIDVLRFEGDPEGVGGSVTLGKNVADGVFVGAKQPVDGSPGSVTVEIEVFPNVTIDSEVGTTTGTSAGINWKKDF